VSATAGVLLADKPRGISSHAVVARARRALGERRVGHAGTLDPFATGLLILLVGQATRLQRLFMALPKTYDVLARVGATSTTGDTEGEITETGRRPAEPLQLPHGRIRQHPPAYSAIKVAGERAYKRARRGELFELPEREVEVYAAEELWRAGDELALRFTCSAGTYVRSLVGALGDAYCLELRRTRIGPFTVDDAWPAEGAPSLLDVRAACARFLPILVLDEEQTAALAHGRRVEVPTAHAAALLTDRAGRALALAEHHEADGPMKLSRL
jgi:tRNA pseudouridine55 synthase